MASTLPDEISRLELLHAAHPDGLVFPHLADAYRRAGRYDQAEDLLDAGLRRHSEYSSAHVVLGRLRIDQGKRAEAEASFRRVLQLDPQNQIALEYLGDLAEKQGRLQEALGLLRRVNRARIDADLIDRIEDLERRVARGSDREGAARERAARVADSGRPGPAAPRSAGNGRAVNGTSVSEPAEVVTETMAELYARQGLHHRAAAVYRQLLERTPGDARLLAKLEQVRASTPRPREEVAREREHGSRGAGAAEGVPNRTPSEPGIRDSLRALVSWRPEPAAPAVRTASRPQPLPRIDPEPSFAPEEPESDSESQLPAPASPGQAPQAAPAAPMAPLPAAPAAPAPSFEPRTVPGRSGLDPLEGASAQTRSLIALTDMLVGLLEYRDPFFRGSSSLTRLLATSVAEELGLDIDERVDLALAAVLRDLGRLALGGKLLANPKTNPNQEARRRIERHVDLALHLMEGIDLPKRVRSAVRHHHERWDGAGYPDALARERIPVLARILSVVDSFAAMVSPRPYRLPRKVPEAAAELQQEAGTRYDPEVVNALVRVLARREQPHLGFVQRHHVLLVNPDQPGAVVTAAKLCSAGYLAEVAVDPATARERLRRVPVSAVVVSAESGVEATAALLRELRTDPLFAALPIVVTDAAGVGLRVRLLESGADVCFPAGVRHAELQGTLGALVRRTLRSGPGADGAPIEAPWLALQGDIQDFPLTWLLQVMKYDSRTAAVGIRGGTREGVIYLKTGDAVHAQIRGGTRGEVALREMMQWDKGRFTVQPDAEPRERTINTSIMHLLLTQAVNEDHAAAGIFGAVSAGG